MTRADMSTLRRAWIFPLAVTLAIRSAFSTFAVVTRGRFRSFPRREPINTTRSTTATALPIRIFLVFDMSLSSSLDTADERIGFFFSSRRRHTRCSRDWSSDVCSSDLDHEQRDPLRLAQALERLAEARRQRERHVSTAERLDRSSPPVRRELEQRGRIGQPPPPVVELRGERLSLKPLPLPVGEVAILDGQLRKRRWPASGES